MHGVELIACEADIVFTFRFTQNLSFLLFILSYLDILHSGNGYFIANLF